MPEQQLPLLIREWISNGPKEMDLTNEEHAQQVLKAAGQILEQDFTADELDGYESQLIDANDETLIFILLVFKLVRSRKLILNRQKPLKVSVVFAVYKEHNRIRKQSEHPHGEDFLVKKVEQLRWLFAGMKNIVWELVVVDDGCPEHSGRIAQEIVDAEKLHGSVRVLFLADGIKEGAGPAATLSSTSESQKGGSIVYGLWDAVQRRGRENHIVCFTDADLSTHLGQLGLLLHPIYKDEKLAAIGSRREKDSVVIKKGTRNTRGKLFIYLWKRMIPNLGAVVDTQCGFKAFRADIIPVIIENMIEKKFAFDIELLLRTALINSEGIAKVGIAWIDSEAASTTTDLQPYLAMLKSIALMSIKYFETTEELKEFTSFMEQLSENEFNRLLDHIPEGILEREPYEFTDYNEVRASDLKDQILL